MGLRSVREELAGVEVAGDVAHDDVLLVHRLDFVACANPDTARSRAIDRVFKHYLWNCIQ